MTPRDVRLYSGERRIPQLEAVRMAAIDRFVSHVASPAGLACVRCACFEMAECDGMWPGGEVAQPRKPPPDLGSQPRDAATITECQSIHGRTYA
jgi:hypothetical protein